MDRQKLNKNCIGASIRIGQEIQCLPYAGFLPAWHLYAQQQMRAMVSCLVVSTTFCITQEYLLTCCTMLLDVDTRVFLSKLILCVILDLQVQNLFSCT